MDSNLISKSWKILCWNVRGINSDKKWVSIRDKIIESNYDIVCLQQKKENFDLQFIKNFCPRQFDSFEFLPSVGASGGIITIWTVYLFYGHLAFSNDFSISVELTSKHDDSTWLLKIYMLLVHPRANTSSCIGSKIFRCPQRLIGFLQEISISSESQQIGTSQEET